MSENTSYPGLKDMRILLGSDILSESVDIMNVRQLHIFTPHWNYEKINQIIGWIRRVGSHDALPPEQRSVNIYLYMAYDSTIPCINSINYSIDYVKYIISEEKYNQTLKYNKDLKNASIESLICSIKDRDALETLQYSTQHLNKTLLLYLSITYSDNINISDKSINKTMEIKIIKYENLLDNNLIKEFYDGITQLSYTEILEMLKYSMKYNLKNIKSLLNAYINIEVPRAEEFVNDITELEKELK
ncbi:hypothetical protein PIROE2DRAFT_11961 [Piromyces sp. E2]|nr:hypothetical protein PIROE2DRAFT_11961 [Piromyces sp. E2]|eukprot:OUM61898.1 hypothetical protein PIROE2DRAFT_11961 [Piromyces sp. E2]